MENNRTEAKTWETKFGLTCSHTIINPEICLVVVEVVDLDLSFPPLNGEPVLYLVIGEGVREYLNVESGIDPFVTDIYSDVSDMDYFDKSFGTGKLFPG